MKVYEVTEEEFEQQRVSILGEPGSIIIVRCLNGERMVWELGEDGLRIKK